MKGEKDFGKKNASKNQLDTIEDHHNKHTIEDQGCSWATPLNDCLGAVCVFSWVLIRHPIIVFFLYVQKHVASIH